jgi:hypothetical protein
MTGQSSTTPMDSGPLQYSTGEEVHAGDRVQYEGTYATIVFMSDGDSEESLPGYEDHSGSRRGVVVCDDDGTITEVGEPDERLSFVDRG